MKKYLLLSSVILLLAFCNHQKKKVIFFGDSITEQAVNPGGFITKMDSIVKKDKLSENYELVGAGVSSNKVYDLYLRLDEDVLDKDPDIVVIFIGVNDVWHKKILGTGTDADKFERFYSAIIKKLTEKNIKVILCTPATIGERIDFTNELDGDLNKYCNIIHKIAEKNNLPLIDLRKIFQEYDLTNNVNNKDRGILTIDGVHFNNKGNEIAAIEMWKVISKL
ncbi:MAG: GDSL-type esterase/lipase family protein [Thermoproteota archaeon]|nr:GDSL-type esterase/lipase family protein [Thermoproteota archaeon]